jgi:hypothetical protein
MKFIFAGPLPTGMGSSSTDSAPRHTGVLGTPRCAATDMSSHVLCWVMGLHDKLVR